MATLPFLEVMGVSVFDPVWSRRWHRDKLAELLCVVHGSMTLETAGKRRRLCAGEFAFVPPHTAHRDLFRADESPDIFLVRYEWAASTAFFETVTNERLAALPEAVRGETLRTIVLLRDHTASDSDMAGTLARSLLHTLLLQLWHAAGMGHDDAAASGHTRQHELMEQARAFLDAHYHEPLTLAGIAERLHVSPYYLSRVFSRQSGFSLMAYLTSARMFKACELLRTGSGNVSEAAYAVGYESVPHFSRVFKRRFGMAPGSLARENRPRRA